LYNQRVKRNMEISKEIYEFGKILNRTGKTPETHAIENTAPTKHEIGNANIMDKLNKDKNR
jgi:hypothetical protein